jgi:hypothetical protein
MVFLIRPAAVPQSLEFPLKIIAAAAQQGGRARYSGAPTLRRYSTTAGLFSSMPKLRAVLPSLQRRV